LQPGPDVHVTAPVRHALLFGTQDVPGAHATQLPPLHTMPEPHVVPSLAGAVLVHVDVPVAHEVVPT
jgi:hypothetical protein